MTKQELISRVEFVLERDAGKKFAEIRHVTLERLLNFYKNAVHFGEWNGVDFDKRGQGGVWACSSCRKCYPYKSDFCPMCGADMRGEKGVM